MHTYTLSVRGVSLRAPLAASLVVVMCAMEEVLVEVGVQVKSGGVARNAGAAHLYTRCASACSSSMYRGTLTRAAVGDKGQPH